MSNVLQITHISTNPLGLGQRGANRPTIGIIGLGNMGSGLARVLASHLGREQLFGFDRSPERLAALPLTAADSARDLVDRVDVVVLAIKPQQLAELETEVRSIGERLLISILAGTPIARLERLGTARIVRAMPNLAAVVGESLTGWVGSPGLSANDRRTIEAVLGSVGTVVALTDEAQLDVLTAVSGSGPGYLAYFAGSMVTAAEQLGFDRSTAESIVRQTFVGTGKLFASDRRSFDEIRAAVTSKGGTTEAGIQLLDEAAVGKTVVRAIAAARTRAQELGRTDG